MDNSENRPDPFVWTGDGVAREVIASYADGRKPPKVDNVVRQAMRDFILSAQATHKAICAVVERVEAPGYAGTTCDWAALERLVLREVREVYGDTDPGAELFARMFTRGDYIF